jgi:hypothetical protein
VVSVGRKGVLCPATSLQIGHGQGWRWAGRRWGRAQRDRILDPYKASGKPHEPTVCPQLARKGVVDEHFDEGGYFVRVNWNRPD